jgi:hypothetical protein
VKFIVLVFFVLVTCNYVSGAAVAEELPYFAQVDVQVEQSLPCKVEVKIPTIPAQVNTIVKLNLINKSSEPFSTSYVKSDCSCAVATVKDLDANPGATIPVYVSLKSSGLSVNRILTIGESKESSRKLTLQITGDARPLVEISPSRPRVSADGIASFDVNTSFARIVSIHDAEFSVPDDSGWKLVDVRKSENRSSVRLTAARDEKIVDTSNVLALAIRSEGKHFNVSIECAVDKPLKAMPSSIVFRENDAGQFAGDVFFFGRGSSTIDSRGIELELGSKKLLGFQVNTMSSDRDWQRFRFLIENPTMVMINGNEIDLSVPLLGFKQRVRVLMSSTPKKGN